MRDITIGNWTKIDELGGSWETDSESEINLDDLLPALDVWLHVPLSEIHHVVHLLPTLDWSGGDLGVRLKFRIKGIENLKAEFLTERKDFADAYDKGKGGDDTWESNTHRFKRRLSDQLRSYNDRHLDRRKTPSPEDYDAPLRTAKRSGALISAILVALAWGAWLSESRYR